MKLKKVEPDNYLRSDMFPANINRLVNQFFDNDVSEISHTSDFFNPSTEIVEGDDSYKVSIAIPGIKKEEIAIELNHGVLEVSGERKSENLSENEKFHLREFSYGKFSRRFKLPDHINADKINAKVEDGILKLNLPKLEEVKPKQILIK